MATGYFCTSNARSRVKHFQKPILIFFTLALFCVACNSESKKDAPAPQATGPRPAARVDAFVVHTRSLSESLEIPGTIVAEESTEIHPEVSGRITQLNVREGAAVSKGALLAKLYDGDLQAQRRKLEVQLKIAESNQSRTEQLVKIGGISQQDYDVTVLNVSNIRADLDIVRTSIAKTEIRAPFSGKLGLKAVSIGAYVTPISIITTIQKTSGLRIDFNVPEKYVGQIKNGQTIKFGIEGSDRTYTAVVAATESGIAENTRSLTIRARVKGNETGLVPGGFAKVNLSFAPDPNALMVPTQAIIPQARGKKVYLYRGGKADFVDVETGIRDSSDVQITQGLKQGDTVIVTGLLGLKQDAKVVVKQIINKQG